MNSRIRVKALLYILFVLFFFYSWKSRATGTTTSEIEVNAKKALRQYYAFLLNAVSFLISSGSVSDSSANYWVGVGVRSCLNWFYLRESSP